MKKITLLCLFCGLTASCSVGDRGFVYQESVNDNVMTINAKSGQSSQNENIIILEKPSVTVTRTTKDGTITNEYSANRGRLNKQAKILTLQDDVHGKSNGNTLTADRLDIKL